MKAERVACVRDLFPLPYRVPADTERVVIQTRDFLRVDGFDPEFFSGRVSVGFRDYAAECVSVKTVMTRMLELIDQDLWRLLRYAGMFLHGVGKTAESVLAAMGKRFAAVLELPEAEVSFRWQLRKMRDGTSRVTAVPAPDTDPSRNACRLWTLDTPQVVWHGTGPIRASWRVAAAVLEPESVLVGVIDE